MSEERAGQAPDDTDLDNLDDELDPGLDEDIETEEGEEPEPADTEEPPEPVAAEPPSRQSREARRVQTLRNRLKQQEDDNRRIRADYDRLLQQARPREPPPDPYRQAELERQEVERVAMMAPHEAAAYYARKSRDELSQMMSRQNVEFGDRLDQQNFSALQRDEPAARRLSAQVEEALATARQHGMNPTREAIYNLLIGQEVRGKMRRAAEMQRRQGRRRVASQATRPGSQRSTAAVAPRGRAGAGDTEEAIAARLMGVVVGSE